MDIDGDGHKDIFSGCYSQRGHKVMIGTFWVLRGLKDGGFAKPTELLGTDGKILMVHPGKEKFQGNEQKQNTCTRPFAVDWDRDGDLDIVTGNFQGTFYVFKGEGSGKFPQGATQLTTAEGRPLRTKGLHSDPYVIDWDGDGDLDLVAAGVTGDVVWAENTLEKTAPAGSAPKLAAFQTLISGKSSRSAKELKHPAGGTRIHVEDVDGDGKLDILMGDRYVGGGELRTDLSDEEKAAYEKLIPELRKLQARYAEMYAAAKAAYVAALKEAGTLTAEEQRVLWKETSKEMLHENEEYKTVYAAVTKLNKEKGAFHRPYFRTGHVWLYLPK